MIFPEYTAMDIAKFVITLCTSFNHSINNLQLQKILWYTQLTFISELYHPAFADDIGAGTNGPIVASVYDAYSSYGATPICMTYEGIDLFNEEELTIILHVVTKCLKYSTWQLIDNSKKGIWKRYYSDDKLNIIPLRDIKEYAESY